MSSTENARNLEAMQPLSEGGVEVTFMKWNPEFNTLNDKEFQAISGWSPPSPESGRRYFNNGEFFLQEGYSGDRNSEFQKWRHKQSGESSNQSCEWRTDGESKAPVRKSTENERDNRDDQVDQQSTGSTTYDKLDCGSDRKVEINVVLENTGPQTVVRILKRSEKPKTNEERSWAEVAQTNRFSPIELEEERKDPEVYEVESSQAQSPEAVTPKQKHNGPNTC
ncbi:hypothetical protein FRX31_004962 [Thalictrum thalictroides]|uniref:Uncharacterized protein n=1 Tax=Thalictrum thalictroides TaxID=46969 RepID=A0A7J6X7U4_THATH|nr:hypothetical protein FRX31_004962 [Thalictrum thalictroides]